LATSIAMIVRTRLRKYSEECKKNSTLPMVYDGDCRVLDSLNNVMQARFCGGYYFGEIAGKRRKLFEALGVPVPDAEPEKEQDYEDEEETEF
jgi:hypothetical protein